MVFRLGDRFLRLKKFQSSKHLNSLFSHLRCEHKRCRQCCKAHCISHRLNCESHRQNFAPKNDQPDTDEAAASKKAKLVTDPAEPAEQDVEIVAAGDSNEGLASNEV